MLHYIRTYRTEFIDKKWKLAYVEREKIFHPLYANVQFELMSIRRQIYPDRFFLHACIYFKHCQCEDIQ